MSDNRDGAQWPKGYLDYVKPPDERPPVTRVAAQLLSERRIAAYPLETHMA
jgi:hypothetical protein